MKFWPRMAPQMLKNMITQFHSKKPISFTLSFLDDHTATKSDNFTKLASNLVGGRCVGGRRLMLGQLWSVYFFAWSNYIWGDARRKELYPVKITILSVFDYLTIDHPLRFFANLKKVLIAVWAAESNFHLRPQELHYNHWTAKIDW